MYFFNLIFSEHFVCVCVLSLEHFSTQSPTAGYSSAPPCESPCCRTRDGYRVLIFTAIISGKSWIALGCLGGLSLKCLGLLPVPKTTCWFSCWFFTPSPVCEFFRQEKAEHFQNSLLLSKTVLSLLFPSPEVVTWLMKQKFTREPLLGRRGRMKLSLPLSSCIIHVKALIIS